jgi:Ca-activated chloride channel family protein
VSGLEAFHFLRPLWLLALPLLGLVWWRVRTRVVAVEVRGGLLAPHLRNALVVRGGARRRFRAVDGMAIALVGSTLAAAGPTWEQQRAPWFSERAPVVVALEVSDSMRANDLAPTRLDRARFEVLELVARRAGARTALVAYAGGAHLVVPPTEDVAVLKPFLESLDPAIMPSPGAAARRVLPLARRLVEARGAGGTVLFVTDGFEETDLEALAAFSADPTAPGVLALVLGTEEGGLALLPDGAVVTDESGGALATGVDAGRLRRAELAGVGIVRARAGDDDLEALLARIASNLRAAGSEDAVWIDRAAWFLWPAALLLLPGFRRGRTLQS